FCLVVASPGPRCASQPGGPGRPIPARLPATASPCWRAVWLTRYIVAPDVAPSPGRPPISRLNHLILFLLSKSSEPVMNQFVHKSLPYDPFEDFVPITLTAKTISVLAVSALSGPKTVKELMARAKAQPGKLNYGAGTITAQLMGHLFHKAAGLDIVYVPF